MIAVLLHPTLGKLPKNTISRNYKIKIYKSCFNSVVHERTHPENVIIRHVSQSIMVASAQGIVVYLQTDAVKHIKIFPVYMNCC